MLTLIDPSECPDGPHRGPQGPNEDVGQCSKCWSISYWMRPENEEYCGHIADCSLPRRHESYCQPGGSGHPPAEKVRGFWPAHIKHSDALDALVIESDTPRRQRGKP